VLTPAFLLGAQTAELGAMPPSVQLWPDSAKTLTAGPMPAETLSYLKSVNQQSHNPTLIAAPVLAIALGATT
jgi:hypothetical protein